VRTTISIDPDNLAAIEALRREGDRGLSETVNDLIRSALRSRPERKRFVQPTFSVGVKIDVTHVADALELLDAHDAR